MEKFKQIGRMRDLYREGGNIIEYLKRIDGRAENSVEDILISYDVQAGTYLRSFAKDNSLKAKYGAALARVIDGLGSFGSILEAGVGEATTMVGMLKRLRSLPEDQLAFDISWSRLKFAKGLLSDLGFSEVRLFTGNLFEIPLADNAVDLVYTSHALEPNGGKEESALRELYRVARKFVVLLEPAYELAGPEAQARMRQHGYVQDLAGAAHRLGYNVVENRLFEHSSNPLNPTGLIVIEKVGGLGTSALSLPVCPITKTRLQPVGNTVLFSKDSLLAYPVLEGIPCLLSHNSILASHMLTDYQAFKKQNGFFIRDF